MTMKRMLPILAILLMTGFAGNAMAGSHNPCNPCAMQKNPCSMKKAEEPKNPCNPCSMKKAHKSANPCNPCAIKKHNPCSKW